MKQGVFSDFGVNPVFIGDNRNSLITLDCFLHDRPVSHPIEFKPNEYRKAALPPSTDAVMPCNPLRDLTIDLLTPLNLARSKCGLRHFNQCFVSPSNVHVRNGQPWRPGFWALPLEY